VNRIDVQVNEIWKEEEEEESENSVMGIYLEKVSDNIVVDTFRDWVAIYDVKEQVVVVAVLLLHRISKMR
jgi:hypothetical protein